MNRLGSDNKRQFSSRLYRILICLLAFISLWGFTSPSATVLTQSGYEGDVTPRPAGKNGAVIQADYEQIGRFAAGLDETTEGSEFQRADCAPLTSLGDGRIGVADFVQAMRFYNGFDPITAAGGPSTKTESQPEADQSVSTIGNESARVVRTGTPTFTSGKMIVPIELVALGNENALGLTLAFPTDYLSNPITVPGNSAETGLLLLNTSQVSSGLVGVVLALPPGQKFEAGTHQILRVTFDIASSGYGQTVPIGFASSPVPLEISDNLGNLLNERIFTGSHVRLLYPGPAITSLNPGQAIAGDISFTVGVLGTNFVNTSVVRWNGSNLVTTYQSPTLLTASIPSSLIAAAGTANITVFTPMPGGGTSNTRVFNINNPIPTLASLGNLTIAAGGSAGSLSIFGSRFVPGAIVYWNGNPCPTRFISSTQLVVDYSAADIACAGLINVTVINPSPGGGSSSVQTFSINPTISAINPTIAYVGGNSFTLTVNGTGFCAGSRIRINGNPRTSQIVSPTQITTTITATELNDATTLQISVVSSDGAVSNQVPFTISACTPASARITMDAALDFGTAAPARSLIPNRPSRTFTIENTGCQTLTINFSARRTGSDVSNGKITNTDDSGTFVLYNITGGVNQEIRSGTPVTIAGFRTWTFRIVFDPKIPAPAGAITNLAASQVIPDSITSTFNVMQGATVLRTANLTGKVESTSRLINPLAPRLAPLVIFNKTGDNEFTVEASGYDANSDIYHLTYQFYDQAGNRVGQAPGFNLDLLKAGLVKGQSFTLVRKFTANECGLNAHQVQVYFYDREDYAFGTSGPIGIGSGRILNATSVSAASFTAEAIAVDGIVSAFGENFGEKIESAEAGPLPTSLAETTVYITDANKVERIAPLFFVSPTQINYLIPEGAVPGEAKAVITNKGKVVASGSLRIAETAPSIFTANSDGKGVPAAYIVRVKPDNSQVVEQIAYYDTVQKKFVPAPINMGSSDDQLFLVLFGTGIRHYSSMNNVSAKIAGVEAEVHYAGPQGYYHGLDQVNIRIPRSLLIGGEIDLMLSIDNKLTNPVRINVR